MKKNEKKALQKKSVHDLRELITKKRKELIDLRMQKSIGKLKNVHAVQSKRKEIASLLTLVHEKELVNEEN